MDFRETVLEEKLIPRALLQDSEPSSAGNAISDVFLVNLSRFKAQEKRVETGGESRERNPNFPTNGAYKGIPLVVSSTLFSIVSSTLFSSTVFFEFFYKKDGGNRVSSTRGF